MPDAKQQPVVCEIPTTLQRVHDQVQREKVCDLSTVCPNCTSKMEPEHAHYRCLKCGYRDSCCF